jgi:hypothetical protein
MLTELDKKIIHHLLNMASEEFANHCCNDFDLTELVPNADERQALAMDMEIANGTPEEFDPNRDHKIVMDWWLMSYMADKVKNS